MVLGFGFSKKEQIGFFESIRCDHQDSNCDSALLIRPLLWMCIIVKGFQEIAFLIVNMKVR